MQKKWYRNTKQAWVGGVIVGLADYFGHDPLLFRVSAIIAIILSGVIPGVLCYLLAWYLVPEIPRNEKYQYEA